MFLVDITLPLDQTNEPQEYAIIIRKMLEGKIEELFHQKRKNDLLNIMADLEVQIKLFDPRLVSAINDVVYKEFGFKISSEEEPKKVVRVIKRGFIKTEKEYRLLKDYFEIISVESDQENMSKQIADLLDSYDLISLN